MLAGLFDAVKMLLLIAAAILALALLPMAILAACESATTDVPQMDEQYWLESGYEPLDKSSTGMYDVRSTMYDVESEAGCARGKGGER